MEPPKRQILYDKKVGQSTGGQAKREPEPPKEAHTAAKVVQWINGHEFFKWSSMCLKIGLDKGNFTRTLQSQNPVIPEKYINQIVDIIKQYGYGK